MSPDDDAHAPLGQPCPFCGGVGYVQDDIDRIGWCVLRGYDLDSVFATQELAQARADLLSGRGVDGVLIEPYDLRTEALDD